MNDLISENLQRVQAHIVEVAQNAGRDPKEVRLIAISKTHPASKVQAAVDAGQMVFGENRVQEALEKVEQLPEHVEWHLVGHLQKNKAKFCPGKFQWVHSIDSVELINTLERRCALQEQPVQGLIQVNLSQEASKAGVWEWDTVCRLGERILECQWLKWRGLMTIGALQASETETRKTFATLAEWRERLVQQFGNAQECTELSMGMSADYPLAIEEGATLIRIGSAIFGARG